MSISSIASSPATSQAAAQQQQAAKAAPPPHHHRKGDSPTPTANKQVTNTPTSSGLNKLA